MFLIAISSIFVVLASAVGWAARSANLFDWWASSFEKKLSRPTAICQSLLTQLWTRFAFRATLSFTDSHNNTLPMLAARFLPLSDFTRVLSSCSSKDLLHTNTEGFNVLHFACEQQDPRYCEAILAIVPNMIDMATSLSRWTPLHVAATKGNQDVVFRLLKHNASNLLQDAQGHTALMISCFCNHHNVVQTILEHVQQHQQQTSTPSLQRLVLETDSKGRTALHLAALRNSIESIHLVLDACNSESAVFVKQLLGVRNSCGYTPVHSACFESRAEVVTKMICLGANINNQNSEGSTPLMTSLRRGNVALFDVLIQSRALLNPCNTFGCTVLHECARLLLPLQTAKVLSALTPETATQILLQQDNDGLCALHCACSEFAVIDPQNTEKISAGLRVLEHLATAMGSITIPVPATFDSPLSLSLSGTNFPDYSDMTPLHVLCYNPQNLAVVQAASILLAHGADASIEDHTGWTPLHYLLSRNSDSARAVAKEITEQMLLSQPKQFSLFDATKPRNTASQKYLLRRGAHNRIPKTVRDELLRNNLTLEGFANYLLQSAATNPDKPPRIVVLTGAGISVSSGIPDFRSPGTGLLTSGKYQNAFSGMFTDHPDDFWNVCQELFYPVVTGKRKPTPVHHFLSLLNSKGWLLRNYTQNVDMLELAAGLPDDKVVECHGSLRSVLCSNPACSFAVDPCSTIPLPTDSPMYRHVWSHVSQGQVPKCPTCSSPLRPNITFFGEQLPKRFFQLKDHDFSQCTAIVVIATSLKVYPFAGLVNSCGLMCPRLLINNQAVGPWQQPLQEAYRDVFWQGSCDVGVWELAMKLGWAREMRNTSVGKGG
eukprot:c11971_g1_i2.p1 GENE.c11971_g1_i2~~c11971_g1_i2.p1  ORF type:complete len:831 (+),score=192.77 c11971_g1_i2:164-2656(+)